MRTRCTMPAFASLEFSTAEPRAPDVHLDACCWATKRKPASSARVPAHPAAPSGKGRASRARRPFRRRPRRCVRGSASAGDDGRVASRPRARESHYHSPKFFYDRQRAWHVRARFRCAWGPTAPRGGRPRAARPEERWQPAPMGGGTRDKRGPRIEAGKRRKRQKRQRRVPCGCGTHNKRNAPEK